MHTAIKEGVNDEELFAEILFLAQDTDTDEAEDDMARYMERNGHFTALFWLTVIFIANHPTINVAEMESSSQQGAKKIAQGLRVFEAIERDIANDQALVQALKLMLYDAALHSHCNLSLAQWPLINRFINDCVDNGLTLKFTKVTNKAVPNDPHPWQALDSIVVDKSWRNSCYLDLSDLKRFQLLNLVEPKGSPPTSTTVAQTPFWSSPSTDGNTTNALKSPPYSNYTRDPSLCDF